MQACMFTFQKFSMFFCFHWVTCNKAKLSTLYLKCVITLQIHHSAQSTSMPAPLYQFYIKKNLKIYSSDGTTFMWVRPGSLTLPLSSPQSSHGGWAPRQAGSHRGVDRGRRPRQPLQRQAADGATLLRGRRLSPLCPETAEGPGQDQLQGHGEQHGAHTGCQARQPRHLCHAPQRAGESKHQGMFVFCFACSGWLLGCFACSDWLMVLVVSFRWLSLCQ